MFFMVKILRKGNQKYLNTEDLYKLEEILVYEN